MKNLLPTFFVLCVLSCTSCYSPQIINTSCAGYRSANFDSSSISTHGLAVMPILGVSGKEQYRKPLEHVLYSNLCTRFDSASIMSSNEATYLINSTESSVKYADAIDIYSSTGIIPKEFIEDVGRSVGKRYLLLSRVNYEVSTIPVTSYEFILNCQIWDTENQLVVWEGKGGAKKTASAKGDVISPSLEGLAGILGHRAGAGNCGITAVEQNSTSDSQAKINPKAIGFVGATLSLLFIVFLANEDSP